MSRILLTNRFIFSLLFIFRHSFGSLRRDESRRSCVGRHPPGYGSKFAQNAPTQSRDDQVFRRALQLPFGRERRYFQSWFPRNISEKINFQNFIEKTGIFSKSFIKNCKFSGAILVDNVWRQSGTYSLITAGPARQSYQSTPRLYDARHLRPIFVARRRQNQTTVLPNALPIVLLDEEVIALLDGGKQVICLPWLLTQITNDSI